MISACFFAFAFLFLCICIFLSPPFLLNLHRHHNHSSHPSSIRARVGQELLFAPPVLSACSLGHMQGQCDPPAAVTVFFRPVQAFVVTFHSLGSAQTRAFVMQHRCSSGFSGQARPQLSVPVWSAERHTPSLSPGTTGAGRVVQTGPRRSVPERCWKRDPGRTTRPFSLGLVSRVFLGRVVQNIDLMVSYVRVRCKQTRKTQKHKNTNRCCSVLPLHCVHLLRYSFIVCICVHLSP